jgi:ABC-type maltose transport system permease subunit
MSSISKVERLPVSAKVQRRVSIGWRLIIAVILIVFSIFPVLWMISASLSPTGSLATQKLIPDNLGLGNYRTLLTSGQFPFWTWFGNSLKVSLITSVVSLAITTVAAYAFSRFRFRGRQTMLKAILLIQVFAGAQFNQRWGVFAAGALLGALPIVIIYLALQDQIVGGLTQGAVKG